jgi:hypothetical protein
MDKWRAVVNAAMNFRKIRGEFLAWCTASTVLCGVSYSQSLCVWMHRANKQVSCERLFVPHRGPIVRCVDQRLSRCKREVCRGPTKKSACKSNASTRQALYSHIRHTSMALLDSTTLVSALASTVATVSTAKYFNAENTRPLDSHNRQRLFP